MLSKQASLDEFRTVALSGNDEVLLDFRRHLAESVEGAVKELYGAYIGFRELEGEVPLNARTGAVEQFLFTALDCLVTATALLVRGWPVPAGNLMRQYSEAVAVALLFSHTDIDAYQRWLAKPRQFNYSDAPNAVARRRNRQLLDVDADAWRSFQSIARWYDQLSHATALAIGANSQLDMSGNVSLNGGFDPSKIDYYRTELVRRGSAARVLRAAMHGMQDRLAELARP